MHRFLAGLILLLLPSFAFAQASGFVESIGFENNYRPDCWNSMVVNITPETSESATYLIQVRQEDLDRDRPIFTRPITLTGAAEGSSAGKQQKFRMYFIPQPTDGGLPNITDKTSTLKDLQERLKVSLTTTSGKWICDLPVTSTIIDADPRGGQFDGKRGSKLILAVGDGTARPAYLDRSVAERLLGVMEDVAIVNVQVRDLPENVIGYDAIDAVVWLNANPSDLHSGGDERFRALEAYIRRGGRLVISQPSDWQRTLEFGELLPVTIEGMRDKQDLSPLRELAQPRNRTVERGPGEVDPWDRIKGPFRVAHAQAKPGAIVDEWVVWDAEKKDFSPYIARKPFGLGSVTWVAQDLGDASITSRVKEGWPNVWDRVFDWKNDPIPVTPRTPERLTGQYLPGQSVDIGATLFSISALNLESKTAWLITLAIVFFIAYWLLAGPGVFAYLVTKRKTQMSWFLFAASAVAATLITVLLVQLVLRGPPEIRHFSIVRMTPNQPAIVQSRFGLYIPRDGFQKIELKDTAPNHVSTISALALNPTYAKNAPDMQGPEYTVPVVEATTSEPAAVRVPYSSTLKQLQTTWVGNISGAVEGSGTLIDSVPFISGALTNGTGVKLRNVYIAFKYSTTQDWVLYLPSWDAGVTIDLQREFGRAPDGTAEAASIVVARPEEGKKLRGTIANGWDVYWATPMRGANMLGDGARDDFGDRVKRSLPMMSFFDRLQPVKNEGTKNDRFELLRRGGRQLDLSGALAAGALVVIAEADAPAKLPFPLEVEGDRIDGTGLNFYQFVLPLDRSKLASSTQPASDATGE